MSFEIRTAHLKLSSIAWSLLGLGIPLLFALVSIPTLLDRIGTERFGILTLAWALLAYASVFDLGIGRATTQYLAELRGRGDTGLAPHVVRIAVQVTLTVSLFSVLVLLLSALWGGYNYINASPDVLAEIRVSIFWMCLVLPLQAASATYRGVNEAFEKFRAVSLVRGFQGAANFAGPLAISFFTQKLYWLVVTLLMSRIMGVALYRWFGSKAIKAASKTPIEVPREELARIRSRLLRFGGWASVSSVLSPLMVQADRFFIAGLLSATAVTAYSLPFEIVCQLLVVVGAITSVVYPALSRLSVARPIDFNEIFGRWVITVAVLMSVLTAGFALVLPTLLPLWLRREVSAESILVGQVLCVGVFANSVGSMYYARLHSIRRSGITARIHLIEVPIYLGALYVLLHVAGIVGAAIAWSGRMILDAFLLRTVSRRIDV